MNFNQFKKLLKQALKELELEVLRDEPTITEDEVKTILDLARDKILVENNIDPQEFFEYEQGLKEIGKAKSEKKRQELQAKLDEMEQRIVGQIPEIPEIPAPQIINKTEVVERTTKEVVREQPIYKTEIVKETTIEKELDEIELEEVKKDIRELQKSIQDNYTSIQGFPRVDVGKLKLDLEKYSADHISQKWGTMPDFRLMGMGLRGDIDKLRTEFDSFSASENLWDKTGTNLTPHTATDTIQPGGYKSSDGTAGASATTGGLTFKDGLYTAGTASSVSFGTTTQIPYMNAGGTDFLYSAGLTFDGSILKVNTNSATALFIEQDGVKDNVFIVDTANGRIGAGIAPSVRMHFCDGVGSLPGTLRTETRFILQANNATNTNAALFICSGAAAISSIYFGDANSVRQGQIMYSNNTDALSFGAGNVLDILKIDGTPRLYVDDSTKFFFGTGLDASIYYDGTNFIINPKEVGTGYLNLKGQLLVDDKIMFTQTDGNEFIDSLADGYLDIAATTGVRLGNGGTTNYSMFEPDGTLVFNGTATVFNDANVGGLVLRTGGTAPGVVQILDNDGDATGIYTIGFAVDEQGSGCIEIPHDYKEGSNIVFHIHWGANDAPGGGTDNVKWQLTYSISRDSNTFPDAITPAAVEVAYTTQYNWLRTDLATITGTTGGVDGGNIKIGDQFHFTIKRIAASADEFGGEALLATAGFHYESDTVGSRTITAK